VVTVTQAASQRRWVDVQAAEQTPAAQMRSPAQARPHIPQLRLSVRGSTHTIEQIWLGAAQTDASVPTSGRHSPARQAKPAAHWTPHSPQLAGSLWTLAQRPEQSRWVAVQAPAQAPPVHTWPAAQAVPHAPQLRTSLVVSTQKSPQRTLPVGQTG
jgi:hypothetical protein